MQKEKNLVKNKKQKSIVLAVDDQPICLSILVRLIEAQGMSVESAHDGEEALLMWKEKRYPFVITDCNMPNMNGYSLTKAIRRIEQKDNLNKSTIAALSSNDKKEEAQLCIDAGMDHVLTKPINSAQIEIVLSQWKKTSSVIQVFKHVISEPVLNDQAPINYSVLIEIVPDSTKHTEILERLQKHIQEDYQKLQLEIEITNLLEVERLAHRMKGACKMVGASGIANACEDIEISAKRGLATKEIFISALDTSITEFDDHMSKLIEPSSNNQLGLINSAST